MEQYKDYNSRWLVLWTVFLLNIANNALWISYSAVATSSAEYYERTIDDIDWLGTIGFLVGIPTCLASTWIVDRFGLRAAIFTGTIMTFLGGLIRAISSFPGIGEHINLNAQFWMAFVGQSLTGMGNPMAVSVPTKVSQHWFKESQRTFATIMLAMSLPLGIVLGQGLTPIFVKGKEDIPTMNWVWFIPAAVTQLLVFAVRSSKPPTPPSRSAEQDSEDIPYMTRYGM
jgi:FLVCR family MFS transporter 7